MALCSLSPPFPTKVVLGLRAPTDAGPGAWRGFPAPLRFLERQESFSSHVLDKETEFQSHPRYQAEAHGDLADARAQRWDGLPRGADMESRAGAPGAARTQVLQGEGLPFSPSPTASLKPPPTDGGEADTGRVGTRGSQRRQEPCSLA